MPRFFSNSYETKTAERNRQQGKRSEVKARLVLHATDTPFGSADQAVAAIHGIVKAHSVAMHLRPKEAVNPERSACAAIECQTRLVIALLDQTKMYEPDKMKADLEERLEKGVPKGMAELFRRCVLENDELWDKGPDLELLEQERKAWKSFRQRNPSE